MRTVAICVGVSNVSATSCAKVYEISAFLETGKSRARSLSEEDTEEFCEIVANLLDLAA